MSEKTDKIIADRRLVCGNISNNDRAFSYSRVEEATNSKMADTRAAGKPLVVGTSLRDVLSGLSRLDLEITMHDHLDELGKEFHVQLSSPESTLSAQEYVVPKSKVKEPMTPVFQNTSGGRE